MDPRLADEERVFGAESSPCFFELPGLLFYDALHLSGAEGLGLLPFVLVPLKRINII